MRKIRGLHADDILQYKAEQNARFLWNSLHRRNVMEELPPYKEEARETEVQEPMPDSPPVIPPRVPTNTFSYVRGQAPPGMYASRYQPFAGGGRGGAGGSQPAHPPQPPAPPPRYALPRYPAPPQMRTHQYPGNCSMELSPPMMNSNLKFSKRSTTSRAIQMTSPDSS